MWLISKLWVTWDVDRFLVLYVFCYLLLFLYLKLARVSILPSLRLASVCVFKSGTIRLYSFNLLPVSPVWSLHL